MFWWQSENVKGGFCVKANYILYWGVVIGVGSGVGRVVGDEVYSNVDDEFGEGVELDVGGKVVSLKISEMTSMWRLVTF